LRIARYILLILFAIIAIFPLYWMVSTALSPQTWITDLELIPSRITLDSFRAVLNKHPFPRWTANSFIVSTVSTIGNLLLGALAAFAFGCLKFKYRDLLFYTLLTTMMMPGFVVVIPRFFLVAEFGWVNSYEGIFVPWWFHMFSVFFLRQYFLSISSDTINVARVDGASLWRIFWRVILPITKPALLALFVIKFLMNWNNLLWPLVLTTTVEMQTLQVGMAKFPDIYQADYGKIMAGSVLGLIPMLILFAFFQKHIEKGIRMRKTF